MATAQTLNAGSEIHARLEDLLRAHNEFIKLDDRFSEGSKLLKQIEKLRATDRIAADQCEAMLRAGAGQRKEALAALDNAKAIGMSEDVYYQNLMQLHAVTGDFTKSHNATRKLIATPPDGWAIDIVNSGICTLYNADLLDAFLPQVRNLCSAEQWRKVASDIDSVVKSKSDMEGMNIQHEDLLAAYDLLGKTLHQNSFVVNLKLQVELVTNKQTEGAALYCFMALAPEEAARLDDALSDLIAATEGALDNPVLPFILSDCVLNSAEALPA